jgi:putative N6-adenine-specific DNA methylase
MTTLKLPIKHKHPNSHTPSLNNHSPQVSGARARVQAKVRGLNSNQNSPSDKTPAVYSNTNNIHKSPSSAYREGTQYGQRTTFTPRNTPKQVDTGFYGTGMSYREAAARRVEQKQAKLARQTGDTPARQYTRDLEFAARKTTNLKPWQGGERHVQHHDSRTVTPIQPVRKTIVQEDVQAAQPFFASCPRGLEWALVKELEAMNITVTSRVASGALLSATWSQIAYANIHSRIASRFLWQLSSYAVRGEDDIYAQVARIPWEKFFNWQHTLKVSTVGIRAEVRSLEFITLRVKDAICDRFRSIDGNRPSIDTVAPDIRVMCVLDGLLSQIYLDTSGEPLFKRGWRNGIDTKGVAALKENLAAGLLALTEWTGTVPLYDPMCGSGTFIIEAAQKAYAIPPNAHRANTQQFATHHFKHLHSLPPNTADVIQPTLNKQPQLFASDINPEMVHIAASNIQAAGVSGDAIHLGCMNVLEITPPTEEAGILVINPPYGERMGFNNNTGEEIEADLFYEAFAANLKRHFKGWSVWLLTSDEKVQARMRLKPNATHHVFNGAIPCRWLKFDIT